MILYLIFSGPDTSAGYISFSLSSPAYHSYRPQATQIVRSEVHVDKSHSSLGQDAIVVK